MASSDHIRYKDCALIGKNNLRVRLNGARGLQVNIDPTYKLATPFFERKSKGLPDFNVLVV